MQQPERTGFSRARHSRYLRIISCVLVLSTTLGMLSCTEKELTTEGSLSVWSRRPDIFLGRFVDELERVDLEWADAERPWPMQVERLRAADAAGNSGSPDMVFDQLGPEIVRAADAGLLASWNPYATRLPMSEQLFASVRAFLRDDSRISPYVLPAALQHWGLWYNRDTLEQHQIEVPSSLAEFETALARLSEAGLEPISLGTAFGSPGLAWFSMLDLRINGPEIYHERLQGERRYDDESAVRVWDRLQNWRDAGWFGTDAAQENWYQAFRGLSEGESAFALLGAFASGRVPESANLGFTAFPGLNPTSGDSLPAAALVDYQLAAFPGEDPSELALYVFDAYITSSGRGQVLSQHLLYPLDVPEQPLYTDYYNDRDHALVSAQLAMTRNAEIALPRLDPYLRAGQEQLITLSVRDFFRDGSSMTAAEIASRMQVGYGGAEADELGSSR